MTVRAIQDCGTCVQVPEPAAPVTIVAPATAGRAVVACWPRCTVHVVPATPITVTISNPPFAPPSETLKGAVGKPALDVTLIVVSAGPTLAASVVDAIVTGIYSNA